MHQIPIAAPDKTACPHPIALEEFHLKKVRVRTMMGVLIFAYF
jgi:hypothetical protein